MKIKNEIKPEGLGVPCYYGCGREAFYKFSNGRCCCESHAMKCPEKKRSLAETQINRMAENGMDRPKIRLMLRQPDHDLKCVICGEKAHFLAPANDIKLCCRPYIRECPKFTEYISEVNRHTYEIHPELIEKQREISKKIHNSERIKQSKSDTMFLLHHGDCDKCKEFQKNYNKGHRKRRKFDNELSN